MTLTGSGSYTNASDASIAAGIFAQSIGGGGGDGGLGAGAVGIGGRGGAAGNGMSVTVDNNANIMQNCVVGSCIAADAIFAQSIGGGGGNGGGSVGLVFAIGGKGGGGGSGGDVTVGSNNANLVTHGDFSRGILAQSIGGGGGTGGFSAGLIALGGDGAGGGIGGVVTVTASGSIHTFGANSEGILAQSIGGGGGNGGGAAGLASLGGTGGSGGKGGTVTWRE
jgi:hypothetical protein